MINGNPMPGPPSVTVPEFCFEHLKAEVRPGVFVCMKVTRIAVVPKPADMPNDLYAAKPSYLEMLQAAQAITVGNVSSWNPQKELE